MAKKHEEEAPAGSPAWMSTFSDLMNLLLCFFVLLFSMSSVDAAKFELVVVSLQSSFSVLTGGTDTIGDGELVGKGISMLSDYDIYLNQLANSNGTNVTSNNAGDTEEFGDNTADADADSTGNPDDAAANADAATNADADADSDADASSSMQNSGAGANSDASESGENTDVSKAGTDSDAGSKGQDTEQGSLSDKELAEEYEEMSAKETEEMAESVKEKAEELGIADLINVSFTSDYVLINLKGALLFDSASVTIKSNAYALLDKVGVILAMHPEHIVDVEGHTDNVPTTGTIYKNNRELSAFRALAVSDYFIDTVGLDPTYVEYSGRGEYSPVADNSTAEGRSLNRRVEIKLYNSYNSDR